MSNFFKKIDWSDWAPIIISLLSLVATILMNIWNRVSIKKENQALHKSNIANDKRKEKLKCYEEALSILEYSPLSFMDSQNAKKVMELRSEITSKINKVIEKNLLLLDDDTLKKYKKKTKTYSNDKQMIRILDELKGIASEKRRDLLSSEADEKK